MHLLQLQLYLHDQQKHSSEMSWLEKLMQGKNVKALQNRTMRSLLDFLGCHNNISQSRRFNTKAICPLTVLEAKHLNSKYRQVHISSKNSGEEFFLFFFLAFCGCQKSLVFLILQLTFPNLSFNCHVPFSLRVYCV